MAEEARLLATCRKSNNPHLLPVVTLALEAGMRDGEIYGLVWERIDFARGVVMLEVTKNGKRREIPMRASRWTHGTALDHAGAGGFENAVVRAGLSNFRFHDCRHHFASGAQHALADLRSHLTPDHLRAEMLKTEMAGSGAGRSVIDGDRAGAGDFSTIPQHMRLSRAQVVGFTMKPHSVQAGALRDHGPSGARLRRRLA